MRSATPDAQWRTLRPFRGPDRSVLVRRDRDPRRPGEPLGLRLLVQEEDGARLGRRSAFGTRELDAAGDERAHRLQVELEALEEAGLHAHAARVPERRAGANEARVALVDEQMDVGGARVRRELDLLHQ